MFGLTERQRKLYDFLLACEQRKYTPSYREMAEHMGLKNHGNIAVFLASMKRRGAVDYLAGQARTVRVIK